MNIPYRLTGLLATLLLPAAAFAAGAMDDAKPMPGDMKMSGCMQMDAEGKDMMAEHRHHLQALHAIATQLAKARTDAQRVALLQRYVSLMDEQQQAMLAKMHPQHDRHPADQDHGEKPEAAPEHQHEHEH
ncbi:hypothetical protein SAMN04488038_11734 [Solimonas aquatica]|uniref:Zinc resistance-associated protein n=1 Tax=Solimonas aquatica TaxID=489703 RepID=A0A1H9LT48_9GAMM|nr:hypothetical protein [Solimonas aquatica]SER14449.1 hypothetical protein SAMN04488038_11734 [Solimonas aquatica]